MTTRAKELERLIREQKADDTYFIPSRHLPLEEATLLETDLGFKRRVREGDGGNRSAIRECAFHGSRDMAPTLTGGSSCRICDRLRQQARRSAAGTPTAESMGRLPSGRFRATGPQCHHQPRTIRKVAGRERCVECLREADRRSYAKKKALRKEGLS